MSSWKGLILAGGSGTRLTPLTQVVNKHLLPVYDKPMIYYPLCSLMMAGIRDVVLVSGGNSIGQFEAMLGDGSRWGMRFTYRVQDRPLGVADGLRVAAQDLAGSNVAMILGDNIFFGAGLPALLEESMAANSGATVFVYEVSNPSAFGILTIGPGGKVIGIEEKPKVPKSHLAVTGLYLYASDVLDRVNRLTPSARGELEISDLNRGYLEDGRLTAKNLGRGVAWLDGGTPKDLFEAGQFVQVMQERTGLAVACPEEIALRKGFIGRAAYEQLVAAAKSSDYGAYLARVLEDPLLTA
jgi:glucose-1-phosphate thymidylyltransferase